MLRDYLRLSMKSLRRRSLRSWLTILGIVVGVAAVVALIAIGEGMQRSVEQQFDTIGYNTIILGEAAGTVVGSTWPSAPTDLPAGGSLLEGRSPEEIEALRAKSQGGAMGGRFLEGRSPEGATQTPVVSDVMSSMEVLESLAELPTVAVTGAQRNETAMITSEGLAGIGILRLVGMTASMPNDFPLYFEGYGIAEGRAFTDEDLHVVVLGPGVAADMVVGIGDEISIQGTPFEVIGILTEPEQVSGGFTVGETKFSLFVPIPALESLFGNQGAFSLAFLEVTDGTNIDIAVQQVRDTFTQAGKPISATTASELSAEIGATLSSVNLTLSAIAGIALLVGVLGVMNTMYMSVLERTREIGIMKAVGAKDRDVLGLFLIESSLLGLIGGALGVLLGVGISGLAGRLISASLTFGTVSQVAESAGLQAAESARLVPAFSPWLILAALGLSLVLGALAGVLPAWRGAKLPPVKALRYE